MSKFPHEQPFNLNVPSHVVNTGEILRRGKTRKDKKAGCAEQNFQNKQARAAYDRLSAAEKNREPFPSGTCNGKRSRALRSGNKRKR